MSLVRLPLSPTNFSSTDQPHLFETAEAWVTKGRKEARIDIKGRGKYGIKHHPSARIHLVIREGLTPSEKEEKQFKRDLGRVKSAGAVREDTPLRRKVVSGWTW